MCHSSTRSTGLRTGSTDNVADSAMMVDPLAEHFGNDQRHAAFGDAKALAVLVGIDPRAETARNAAMLVYDGAFQHRVGTHFDVRKNDAAVDFSVVVHAYIGK